MEPSEPVAVRNSMLERFSGKFRRCWKMIPRFSGSTKCYPCQGLDTFRQGKRLLENWPRLRERCWIFSSVTATAFLSSSEILLPGAHWVHCASQCGCRSSTASFMVFENLDMHSSTWRLSPFRASTRPIALRTRRAPTDHRLSIFLKVTKNRSQGTKPYVLSVVFKSA